MRLSVFNYPLDGWTDAVVMNFCMGHAVAVQLEDLMKASYQPLADAIRAVAPKEQRHTELAEEGLIRLRDGGGAEQILESLAYWKPRVHEVFGDPSQERLAQFKAWGLRHRPAAEMRDAWQSRLSNALKRLSLAG